VRNKDEKSFLYKHKRETQGHEFDFDNMKIIASEEQEKPRRFIEATYTKLQQGTINKSIDIPKCYMNILRKTLQ